MKAFIRVDIFLIIALVLPFGCSDSPPGPAAPSDNVVSFESTDPAMRDAISKAKKSFGFFKENWKSMDCDNYGIKFGLKTADNSLEHIWFTPSSINGSKIIAECANTPVAIPNLRMGDVRMIDEKHISDWMIIVGDKCYGGYTVEAALRENPRPQAMPKLKFIHP